MNLLLFTSLRFHSRSSTWVEVTIHGCVIYVEKSVELVSESWWWNSECWVSPITYAVLISDTRRVSLFVSSSRDHTFCQNQSLGFIDIARKLHFRRQQAPPKPHHSLRQA